MLIPDINILIYAQQRRSAEHDFYRSWLESQINAGHKVGLSSLVLAGYVRIVTNANFPPGPTPLEAAFATIDAILAMPNCHLVLPGQRHWPIFNRLCLQSHTTGKSVADAQHAAIAVEQGATFVTRDRDLLHFQPMGLTVQILEPA